MGPIQCLSGGKWVPSSNFPEVSGSHPVSVRRLVGPIQCLSGGMWAIEKCTACRWYPPPQTYCVNCALAICWGCHKVHSRVQGASHHILLSLLHGAATDVTSGAGPSGRERVMDCTQHEHQPLRYCCVTCDKLLCGSCKTEDHEGCLVVAFVFPLKYVSVFSFPLSSASLSISPVSLSLSMSFVSVFSCLCLSVPVSFVSVFSCLCLSVPVSFVSVLSCLCLCHLSVFFPVSVCLSLSVSFVCVFFCFVFSCLCLSVPVSFVSVFSCLCLCHLSLSSSLSFVSVFSCLSFPVSVCLCHLCLSFHFSVFFLYLSVSFVPVFVSLSVSMSAPLSCRPLCLVPLPPPPFFIHLFDSF